MRVETDRNEWKPGLRQVGLYRFAGILLCTIDRLLGTRFRNGWNLWQRLGARCFSYIFLTDSDGFLRSLIKFAFLPLRPSEILRIWYEKAGRLLSVGFINPSLLDGEGLD